MSVFQKYRLLNLIKVLLKNTVFKPGRVATIIRGPLKGCRYVINEDSGWAPIYGGWEPAAQVVYRQFIRPGNIVYDLGANTGIHSLLFSRLVGTSGKVYAFEPIAKNIREIESVKSLNGAANIRVIGQAVSNFNGSAKFKIGRHNKQGSLVGIGCETDEEVQVSVTTLDKLIADGLEPPDFVKIDVEGAEHAALEGLSGSLNTAHPVFAIDLHTPEQDQRVGQFFKQRGYRVYRLNDETAQRMTNQTQALAEIHRLDLSWPDPQGIWGTIIAVHPASKVAAVGETLARHLETQPATR